MNLEITKAEMKRVEDRSFVGRTVFTFENHRSLMRLLSTVPVEPNGITA